MQVIAPITPTGVSNTIAENEFGAYAAGTTYAVGAKVVANHRIYESLSAGNLGNTPATSPLAWLDTGPTNSWSMFDPAPTTRSTATTSISVTFTVTAMNAVVLVGLVAANVKVFLNSVQIRDTNVPAPVAPATNTDLVISGLSVASGTLRVDITGTGTIGLAYLMLGNLTTLGLNAAGVEVGILDFSKKETDQFGNVSVTPRSYSRRLRGSVHISYATIDTITRLMASLRARICYWMASPTFQTLQVLGFVKEWDVSLRGTDSITCSYSIEGFAAGDAALNPGQLAAPDVENIFAMYRTVIESTNGDIFRVGAGTTTTLIARIFRNDVEVTAEMPGAWFRWRRVSRIPQSAPNDDATWNATYASGFKQVTVNVDDVLAQATFFCDLIRP